MPNGRCRAHGGVSTGPQTQGGLTRAVAAMVAGRRAYLERMKREGRKLPWGFKKGWRAGRAEAQRIAAMPPIDQKREAALAAIARMKANLKANLEAGRC
jgi:hypothetical protein